MRAAGSEKSYELASTCANLDVVPNEGLTPVAPVFVTPRSRSAYCLAKVRDRPSCRSGCVTPALRRPSGVPLVRSCGNSGWSGAAEQICDDFGGPLVTALGELL